MNCSYWSILKYSSITVILFLSINDACKHVKIISVIFKVFEKNRIQNVSFDFLYNFFSETYFILRRNERDMIKNTYWSSCKVSFLFLPDSNETWVFSTHFRKILKYKISWKSVQQEPRSSMRTDRRTYMTKLVVAFQNFSKAPEMERSVVNVYRVGITAALLTYCQFSASHKTTDCK
jgi:hypothetical protein